MLLSHTSFLPSIARSSLKGCSVKLGSAADRTKSPSTEIFCWDASSLGPISVPLCLPPLPRLRAPMLMLSALRKHNTVTRALHPRATCCVTHRRKHEGKVFIPPLGVPKHSGAVWLGSLVQGEKRLQPSLLHHFHELKRLKSDLFALQWGSTCTDSSIRCLKAGQTEPQQLLWLRKMAWEWWPNSPTPPPPWYTPEPNWDPKYLGTFSSLMLSDPWLKPYCMYCTVWPSGKDLSSNF